MNSFYSIYFVVFILIFILSLQSQGKVLSRYLCVGSVYLCQISSPRNRLGDVCTERRSLLGMNQSGYKVIRKSTEFILFEHNKEK